MSFSRKTLKAMGFSDEQVESLIEMHSETVEGLKSQMEQYKADAEKLPEVQRELDTAKEAAKNSGDAQKIQKDFDDFKAEVQAKEIRAKKEAALRKVAKDAGLTEAGISKEVKYRDYGTIELDDKGDIKNAKDLIKSMREEWPEYIASESSSGAQTSTPPGGDGGSPSGANSRAAQLYNQHYQTMYGQTNPSAGKDEK